MPDQPFAKRPSPVLLIIPLVLTLAGIGLTIMFYLQYNDKRGDREGSLALEEKIQREVNTAMATRDEYVKRRDSLKALLGYDGDDYQEWLRQELAGKADFKSRMEDYQATIARLKSVKAALEADHARLLAEIRQTEAEKARLIAARQADFQRKTSDLKTLEASFTPRTDDLLKRLAEAGTTADQKRRELEAVLAQHKAETARQNETIITLQREVDMMEDAIAERRRQAQTVDGRILTVPPGAGTVTVDLGRRQRVRQGMRFKVVDKGQLTVNPDDPKARPIIPDTATFKGEIEITHVYETQSQAQVLNLNFANPMLPNDGIYNPAFHPGYRTKFVVVGLIDLDGDGTDDAEEVANLIAEIGGDIQDEVTIATDFLLVGQNWPTVEPELRRRYWRDQEQIKAAEQLDVSFLSVRRFLDFVGVQAGRDGGLVARTDEPAGGRS